MLLTISSSDSPARDLGYLLGKHPDRAQSLSLAHGTAHVCFPEATDERCTCALVLDVDPIGLVRRSADDGFALSQYTNDRPYVASSFLSVAIGRVFGQALAGRCAQRPDLASRTLPLEARLPCVAVHGGERFVRTLFEPLGYEVESERGVVLDEAFPEWGHAPYHALRLEGRVRLSELLRHLTVLLPVLDDDKHYFVGKDEVEKLLARGEGWLASHPERDSIVRRYLKHRGSLTREALLRLSEEETDDPDRRDEEARQDEETLERTITLAERRLDAVMAALEETGARTVADLGCGEGKLLRRLLAAKQIERIVGMDVSVQALERASARLHLDELAPRQRARVELLQGSVTYRDARLEGLDAACLVEVVEHVEPSRLAALERVVFEHAAPRCVIVTTPNVEYNARFETLPAGKLRHRDHRFEWTRDEFRAWATSVAHRHGYALEIRPIGPVDDQLGAPTQMGVFTR